MLLSKTTKIKWNPKIKNHYVNLGYVYTKMGDEFVVSVNHLTTGSNALVQVKCDYCGATMTRSWCTYLTEHNTTIPKDCCTQCKKHKIVETCLECYGVTSVFCHEETAARIAQTNIERYGVANPFDSQEVQERIRADHLARYGVVSPTQRPEVVAKISATCRERYGVNYYIETQRLCGADSPQWKGGVARQRNERYTSEYRNWRKGVYGRDKYTCVCCDDSWRPGHDVKFNAHHLYNWGDYPERRYDIDNGVTLCVKCHNEFHRIYGKHHNTPDQFFSYLTTIKRYAELTGNELLELSDKKPTR